MATTKQTKARFDARLSKRQKEFFEKAAMLGGYRNLTDFVILTVQERAKEIIEEHEQIISSQKDSNVFFEALINPPKPNKALRKAVEEYKKLFQK
ncbi:MAG: DUF1778 domain-containing protein [Bacteroidia bacterium]